MNNVYSSRMDCERRLKSLRSDETRELGRPRGRSVHCPRGEGVLSRMDSHLWHTSLSPHTYLVRSLWLCNNRRPIPKRSTAATVLAVGDDSGIVRVFYAHALHLPGDRPQIFGCKQTRGEQTRTWATRSPADRAPPGRLAQERDRGWSAVRSLSTRRTPPE